MPRPRTGSLELRPDGWHARITADVRQPDGSLVAERRWIKLDTFDKTRAKRLLAKLVSEVEAGRLVAEAKAVVTAPETFAEYATSWHERRKLAGVKMALDEKLNLDRHILPLVGGVALVEFRPAHAREVLAAAVAKGLARESVRKIRGVMHRVLNTAFKSELVSENPILRVDVPDDAKEDNRDRVILTDAEVQAYMASPIANPELKVMAVSARVLGGMRTAELNRWTWPMLLDAERTFAEVQIQRAKAKRGRTGRVQTLIVPAPVRAILRAWWEAHGCPDDGPVFPVRQGRHKGQHRRERGTSYARRLRFDLLRAGIKRHACTRPETAPPVCRGEACCPRFALDPLYAPTATSRPVDWHSFRRAFASALAGAGVNIQTAMALTSHDDARTHGIYLMKTDAMKRIPEAAIPQLNAGNVVVLPRRVDDSVGPSNDTLSQTSATSEEIQYARSDSNRRHSASKAGEKVCNDETLREFAPWCWVERARGVAPCFVLRRGDSAPRGRNADVADGAIEGESDHLRLSARVGPTERVWGGVVFQPVDGVPDRVAAIAEAVSGMGSASYSFMVFGAMPASGPKAST